MQKIGWTKFYYFSRLIQLSIVGSKIFHPKVILSWEKKSEYLEKKIWIEEYSHHLPAQCCGKGFAPRWSGHDIFLPQCLLEDKYLKTSPLRCEPKYWLIQVCGLPSLILAGRVSVWWITKPKCRQNAIWRDAGTFIQGLNSLSFFILGCSTKVEQYFQHFKRCCHQF